MKKKRQKSLLSSAPPDVTKYEDWVWTVQTMSRTNYAMARTLVSSKEGWTEPDTIPLPVGVEVKRYQRQCRIDSTPHLKHAVTLGIRVMVGMEYLLQDTKRKASTSTSIDERMVFWSRIERESYGTSSLLENYQCGPNNSIYDLSHVLKCRVFPEEAHYEDKSLRDQIRQGLKINSIQNLLDENFTTPRPDQVDDEDWLELKKSDEHPNGALGTTEDLDHLLTRFQTFMNQSSDVEGIASNKNKSNGVSGIDEDRPIVIRPRVFLNIMHAIFKGEKLEFPTSDPYFYQEDYDLMESDGEDDDEDDENTGIKGGQIGLGLQDIMVSNVSQSPVVISYDFWR